MVSERQRAQKMGYPSPIHATIEATHACYDGNVQMALQAMARGEKVELLVASHNQVGRARVWINGSTSVSVGWWSLSLTRRAD